MAKSFGHKCICLPNSIYTVRSAISRDGRLQTSANNTRAAQMRNVRDAEVAHLLFTRF